MYKRTLSATGAGQRKHSKDFKNDDDAEVSGGRGQDGVRGMEVCVHVLYASLA